MLTRSRSSGWISRHFAVTVVVATAVAIIIFVITIAAAAAAAAVATGLLVAFLAAATSLRITAVRSYIKFLIVCLCCLVHWL